MNRIAMLNRRLRRVIRWMPIACLALGSIVHAEEPDQALFWSLQMPDGRAGYLLGTIHSEDPRVLDFSDAFLAELESCDSYAMEMVPDLPTLNKLTQYMQYDDGRTLESQVGAERFQKIEQLLSAYQVPSDWIARMKVWAAMMTLSVPPPETGFFMDFSLSLRASGGGLKVIGLETLEEQLSFLENMPLDQQLSLLDQAIEEYHAVREAHDQMVEEYLKGDLVRLQSTAQNQLEDLDAATRDYFLQQGIDARNHRMLASAMASLQQGCTFIAVGALHLPGPEGLINLLRREGYTLVPLPPPVKAPTESR